MLVKLLMLLMLVNLCSVNEKTSQQLVYGWLKA